MKKILVAIMTLFMLVGCSSVISEHTQEDESYDLSFKDDDLDASFSDGEEIVLAGEKDVTISIGGTYILSGELEGSVIVDASDSDKVRLVLDGVTINSDDFAAIYVINADKVTITLNEGSENYLSDSDTYNQIDDNNVDGVIFSKADLVINGSGSLYIDANYKHGIVSKDDLIIAGGTYIIASTGSALAGKDCVKIADGNFTLNSNADAIKSTNEEAGKGYIYIIGGSYSINAVGDGISSTNLIDIENGTLVINTTENETSAKGIKCTNDLVINGGTYTFNTKDDALHAGNSVTITCGELSITTSDDAIHSDADLTINGGTINALSCYEGIEGAYITVNDGDISIISNDDGFNASNKNSSGSTNFQGNSTDATLTINGGTIYVNARGDGLDSNGTITINGGSTIVEGPSDGGNAAFDYETGGYITGGELICIGNSSMAESFSDDSTQVNLLYNFDETFAQGSTIVISDSEGNEVFNLTSTKTFNSILVSSESFNLNDEITITINGTAYTYTLSNTVNTEGEAGMGMGAGMMGGFNKDGGNNVTPPSDSSSNSGMQQGEMPNDFNPDDISDDFSPDNLPEDFDSSKMPGGDRGQGSRPDMPNRQDSTSST